MNDLLVALGLVLVFEGLIWALSPTIGLRLLAAAAATSHQSLRLSGIMAVGAGMFIVWLIRG